MESAVDISYMHASFLIDKLKSKVIDGAMLVAVFFDIFAEIPSGPLDFDMSMWLRSSHTSSVQ